MYGCEMASVRSTNVKDLQVILLLMTGSGSHEDSKSKDCVGNMGILNPCDRIQAG